MEFKDMDTVAAIATKANNTAKESALAALEMLDEAAAGVIIPTGETRGAAEKLHSALQAARSQIRMNFQQAGIIEMSGLPSGPGPTP